MRTRDRKRIGNLGFLWGTSRHILAKFRRLLLEVNLTPFDTNWKRGGGATPLTARDLLLDGCNFDPHRPYQLPFGIWYLQKTRLQLKHSAPIGALMTACLDTSRVGFNCTSLRVSYNVTVDSKRYASL